MHISSSVALSAVAEEADVRAEGEAEAEAAEAEVVGADSSMSEAHPVISSKVTAETAAIFFISPTKEMHFSCLTLAPLPRSS